MKNLPHRQHKPYVNGILVVGIIDRLLEHSPINPGAQDSTIERDDSSSAMEALNSRRRLR